MKPIKFDQPLPRKLVHKWAPEQILLTDHAQKEEDEFILGAILPRTHILYREDFLEDEELNLSCLVEICRQACFVTAHCYYEIPIDSPSQQFLLQELDAEVTNDYRFNNKKNRLVPAPTEIGILCKITEKKKRGKNYSGLTWNFTLFQNSNQEALAKIIIKQTWINKDLWLNYRRIMRRDRGLHKEICITMPCPIDLLPARVSRKNERNILLRKPKCSNGVFVAELAVDARHPVFFDHAIDHVYAMVQLEACCQFTYYIISNNNQNELKNYFITGYKANYLSIAEFDSPIVLHCKKESNSEGVFSITLSQKERVVSNFIITVLNTAIKGVQNERN